MLELSSKVELIEQPWRDAAHVMCRLLFVPHFAPSPTSLDLMPSQHANAQKTSEYSSRRIYYEESQHSMAFAASRRVLVHAFPARKWHCSG